MKMQVPSSQQFCVTVKYNFMKTRNLNFKLCIYLRLKNSTLVLAKLYTKYANSVNKVKRGLSKLKTADDWPEVICYLGKAIM